MKPDRPDGLVVRSTLQGEEIGMSFDENSLVHIMSILTDLYSDPDMAIVREYSTNALDAHIEAGQTRPIEVSTPSPLSPFFRVKDFGVGLSADDIRNIYSKYGASTKRSTNEQVGMLGLGCKAALTYTTQFTLVGIKDGWRTVVSISRDEDGAGSMTIIEHVRTDESNGVEIVVPVRRNNTFAEKASSFFRFWRAGTVLVDGQAPEPLDGLEITSRLFLARDTKSMIVMGNVAYPAPDLDDLSFNHSNFGLVADVEVGTVNFVPSREALHMTGKTKRTIEAIKEEFNTYFEAVLEESVESAKTPYEALIRANRASAYRAYGHSRKFTYRGAEFPAYVLDDPGSTTVPRNRGYSKYSRHTKHDKVGIFYSPNTLWFYGFNKPFTANRRKKLDQWVAEKGIDFDFTQFALLEYRQSSPWIDASHWFDWAEVEAIRLPRTKRAETDRLAGSFDLFAAEDHSGSRELRRHVGFSPALFNKRLFYFVGNHFDAREYAELLFEVTKGQWTLVYFGVNRKDKFRRDFPHAKEVDSYLRRRYRDWLSRIPSDKKNAMQLKRASYDERRVLTALEPDRIADPELRAAIEALEMDIADVEATYNAYSRLLGLSSEIRHAEDLLNEYPLAMRTSWLPPSKADHIYIYLNAVYETANQEQSE